MDIKTLFAYTLGIIVLLAAAVAIHVAIPSVPLPVAALVVVTPGVNVLGCTAVYMQFVAKRK
jgi:hypothetical protein